MTVGCRVPAGGGPPCISTDPDGHDAHGRDEDTAEERSLELEIRGIPEEQASQDSGARDGSDDASVSGPVARSSSIGCSQPTRHPPGHRGPGLAIPGDGGSPQNPPAGARRLHKPAWEASWTSPISAMSRVCGLGAGHHPPGRQARDDDGRVPASISTRSARQFMPSAAFRAASKSPRCMRRTVSPWRVAVSSGRNTRACSRRSLRPHPRANEG